MIFKLLKQSVREKDDKHSPYVPLRYTLMGSFLLLIIPILIATSTSDYLNARSDLENAYQLLQNQTENNILNAIRLVNAGQRVLENILGQKMRKGFDIFLEAYEKSKRNPAKIDLETLKKRLDSKMDLYVINAEGVIEYSTYKRDLGLDFKQWPENLALLRLTLETGEFINGSLSTEVRTGTPRIYAYMATPDKRYVLELGVILTEFDEILSDLDLIKITDRLKGLNPTLNKIRIFNQNSYLVGDLSYRPDEETAKIVRSVYEQKKPYKIYDGTHNRHIHYIFLNLKDENILGYDPSRVVELTYNNKLIDEGLQRIAAFHFIIGVMAIILSIVVTFIISAWITHPIQELVKNVNIIANGNLEHPLEVKANNELKLLRQSISIMVDSMLNYITKIRQQNIELKELDRLKDDFLSNTSHELRTPINGIIGIADSLIDGAAGALPTKAIKNLSMIAFSGRRLSNLVNDILDFSKLKHKKIELQIKPVEIKIVVEVILTLSRPLIGNKNLELINSIDEDYTVDADENRIQQVLHNLVANAIKFTESGFVELTAAEYGDCIMIAVTDTGIGISPEKLDKIFIPFEQADGSIAREYGGTGLGLSITKQLVELHGGEIRIQSTVGTGTKVSFTLPRSQGEANQYTSDIATMFNRIRESEAVQAAKNQETISKLAPEENDPSQDILLDLNTSNNSFGVNIDLEKMSHSTEAFNILIVDDDTVNLQVLENQLTLENYRVTRATNGQEALEAMNKGIPFVLILLDIMMPKMSGFEVCRIIRQTYPATQLPIIMLTAKNQVSDLAEGLRAGANDYLTKPFSKGELITRIKTHIQLSRINTAYSNFVPLEFLKLLEKESIVEVHLGDHIQKRMAILFSDIRAFTSLSETMTPKENFDFINTYLRRVSPVIRKHNGFIDKYIGDAIMALFSDSADDALQAAIEIHQQLRIFNEERRLNLLQPVRVGIGLHFGTLMLGTIGEEKRMEGTVISDAVNLASRLEGLTKIYGSSIIVSGDILAELEDPTRYFYRFLGKVRVKGKKELVFIFEVVDAEPEEIRNKRMALEPLFREAIELFYQRQFKQAAKRFSTIFHEEPQDTTAHFYLGRCEYYIEHGVPPDWEGVETSSEK